jgi:hypothetical protein
LGTSERDAAIGTDAADLVDLKVNPSSEWQRVEGSAGNDVYVFGSNYGRNAIFNEDNGDSDTIVFRDLNHDDLSVSRHSNGLEESFVVSGGGLELHIHGRSGSHSGIENFIFADGRHMTEDEFLF